MASNLDKLLENVDSTQKGMSAPGFDMNKFMLPDSEIAKNLIASKNPNMTKGDINLMVDGIGGEGEQSDVIKEMDSLSENADTPYKRKRIDDNVADTKRGLSRESKGSKSKKSMPISEDDHIYEEVREIKRNITEKSTEYVTKVGELVQDTAFASIAIIQSIPGAILLLAAMNIPGMITMLMNIILTLNSIKSKAADVNSIFVHFTKIGIVCSPKDANKVAGILNALFKVLNTTILGFTSKIDAFTGRASDSMKDSMSKKKEAKRIRTITKQLRKMDYLPNNNFNEVDEDDEDSIDAILVDWEVVDRTHKRRAVRRKKESQDALDSALDALNKLDNINKELRELTNVKDSDPSDEETIVYDIELPDGTLILGLSKDEITGYSKTYNVIYSTNLKFIENPTPFNLSPKIN